MFTPYRHNWDATRSRATDGPVTFPTITTNRFARGCAGVPASYRGSEQLWNSHHIRRNQVSICPILWFMAKYLRN